MMSKEIYVVAWHSDWEDYDGTTYIGNYSVEETSFETLEAAQNYVLEKSREYDRFEAKYSTGEVTEWALVRSERIFTIIRTTVQEEGS